MIRRLVLLASTAVLACAVLQPAVAQPSRVIDRTFVCATGYLGGLYQLDVRGTFGTFRASEKRVPFAGVSTNLPDGFLGDVNTRAISVNRVHCKPTSAKTPLTTKGLRGGAFDPLGSEFTCETPRRVLLRIRGVFAKPTALRARSPFGYPRLQADGDVTEAAFAIATLAGKPIAYVSIVGPKKTLLYTARNCEED